MHSADPSTPKLFLPSHYVFKAWAGSFPRPVSSQVYTEIWFIKSGFASPARNPSNNLCRGSGAQHILRHTACAAAFGMGRGAAPLQQLVQRNTPLSSAQSFPPWSQDFGVSSFIKSLLHLPKLPPSCPSHSPAPLLPCSLTGASRPLSCEISALASAAASQRDK